jgi:DNA-binding response OmpR family regulator
MNALVVEREWDVRESLKKKLQARGFDVSTVDTAEDALNLCIIIDFELVITASILPEMSGFRLVERITQGRRDLKIRTIVLLNRDGDPMESLARYNGVDALLRKPITEDGIARCLDKETIYTEAHQ